MVFVSSLYLRSRCHEGSLLRDDGLYSNCDGDRWGQPRARGPANIQFHLNSAADG